MIFLLPFIVWIFGLAGGGSAPPDEMPWSDSDDLATEAMATVDQLPVARFQSRPAYPFMLWRRGVSGSAEIGFIVDTDGNVRDPFVRRATHEEFGVAAVKAVSRWKFRPAFKAGHPVNTRMSVPVIFNIQDSVPPVPDKAAGKSRPPPSGSP